MSHYLRNTYSALLLLLLLSLGLRSQPTHFGARLDTHRIALGQQVDLHLEATLPRDIKAQWPVWPDTLSHIELVKAYPCDTSREQNGLRITQRLRLTSFDSGYHALPPLSLQLTDTSLMAPALALAVDFPELAPEGDYHDIKAPLEAPFPWLNWVLGLLGLTLLGIGIWLGWQAIRHRPKPGATERPFHLPPLPHARAQLEQLTREGLWQKGEIKAYYSRLTDILRLFLERQYKLNAMERTAGEVVELLREQDLPPDLQGDLEALMQLSALVKYARHRATEADHRKALQTARQYLDVCEKRLARDEEENKTKPET